MTHQEWALKACSSRSGVVFVSLHNHVLSRAFSLTEPCSNNVTEYNALLIGLQLAQQMGVQYLKAYGDSKLIVNQIKGQYEVRHEDLIPYHHAVIQLANTFDGFYISHMSRLQNKKVEALAALVATLVLLTDTSYRFTMATCHLFYPKYSLEVSEVHATSTNFKPRDRRFFIIDHALHDILPDDPKEAASIRRRSPRFYYDSVVKTLYRCSYDGILFRSLSNTEAREVIKEAHEGIWGAHQPGLKLKDRLHRLGYYLPIMITDSNMQDGVRLVKFMRISCTNSLNCFTPQLLHGHLKSRESMLYDPSVLHQLEVIGLFLQ